MNREPIDIPCIVVYDEVDSVIEIEYMGLMVSYPMIDLENADLYRREQNMVNEKIIFATKRQIEMSLMTEN